MWKMDDDSVFALLDDIDSRARPQDNMYPLESPHLPAENGYQMISATQSYPYAPESQYYNQGGDVSLEQVHPFESEAPFDAFDKELLRLEDGSPVRETQDGRTRVSLPPRSTNHASGRPAAAPHNVQQRPTAAQRLSQFAYNPLRGSQTCSSHKAHGLPSSPAFRASQRRNSSTTKTYVSQPRRMQHSQIEEDEYGWTQEDDFRPEYFNTHSQLPPKNREKPPTVQGIELVPTRGLPDRFRSVFPFPLFNAVQSKCFQTIYQSNDNFVVSSPTGSGKTVIFELAILRLVNKSGAREFKIIYQAPTKSLCSERQRDWQKKFGPLGLDCAEMTGDSTSEQLRAVQTSSIIVTTPEKWDSMTRRWKDHEKLIQLVKLFLIDEVHILKEDRGATLEAIVSRMKNVGSDVRFVAVSATVPNFADIAKWLGKNPMNQAVPACKERFGDEFRPVQLQKHVVGYPTQQNDFGLDGTLSHRLPEIISKYSQRKPIMIFCCTRNSTTSTAKFLAQWWSQSQPKERYWESPKQRIVAADQGLQRCISSGVAFHHAGLDISDRQAVEAGFLDGHLNVICCTSTLAIGVNLPCHFVIIKNTVGYSSTGLKEYSDLEIMQMLGRAGRPQFDDGAVAVIMTRIEKVSRYEKMVSGQEILESRLHLNLIEHLNAEIGLGTVTDTSSARNWLGSTFLCVRLQKNPDHYNLGKEFRNSNIDECLGRISNRNIAILKEHDLVAGDESIHLTEYGDIMARYYVRLESMKNFLGLERQAKLSEILSALAEAEEFKEIRFRSGDKTPYRDLNKSPSIKFSIPVNLDKPAHKVSLIIQSVLGGTELPTTEKTSKHTTQYQSEVSIVFQQVRRLIRCIIDCAIYEEDSVTARNALSLARSLSARVWDDSPLQMKQIENIGFVAVRKLVNAGIRSIEELEDTEARRIETILGKNPPYGIKLLHKLKGFPKLRVSLKQTKDVKMKQMTDDTIKVELKAGVGFLNDTPPKMYQKMPLYVCILAETSDGHMVLFRRISAAKLDSGQDVFFSADITSANQVVTCYVMCDDIAGTMRQATVAPVIPPSLLSLLRPQMNTSRRRSENAKSPRHTSASATDEFGDGGIDDADLAEAVCESQDGGFLDIDDISDMRMAKKGKNKLITASQKSTQSAYRAEDDVWEPTRLDNGRWACNHVCKDKTSCKHLCCKEGLDKPPKTPRNKKLAASEKKNSEQHLGSGTKKQTKLTSSVVKSSQKAPTVQGGKVEQVDLTHAEPERRIYLQETGRSHMPLSGPLQPLKSFIGSPSVTPSVRITHKKPRHNYERDADPDFSFLPKECDMPSRSLEDYDTDWREDQPLVVNAPPGDVESCRQDDATSDEEDSVLDDAMVGLADSLQLQTSQIPDGAVDEMQISNASYGPQHSEEDAFNVLEDLSEWESSKSLSVEAAQHKTTPEKSLFVTGSSSDHPMSSRRSDHTPVLQKRKEEQAVASLSFQAPDKKPRLDNNPTNENTAFEQVGPSLDVDSPEPSGRNEASGVKVPSGYEGIEPWIIEMVASYVEFA